MILRALGIQSELSHSNFVEVSTLLLVDRSFHVLMIGNYSYHWKQLLGCLKRRPTLSSNNGATHS